MPLKNSSKNTLAGKARRGAELLFDTQQLIVFRNAVGTRSRSGLDLSRRGRYGEIRDKGILGFTGAMGNNRVVPGLARQFDGVNRLGHAADLVQLDQNRICDSVVDAARKALG